MVPQRWRPAKAKAKPAILPAFPNQLLPMPPAESPVYQTLRQQYQDLGWPLDLLDEELDFTIFDLADLPLPLPLSAPASRLNFFVFGFIKAARGTYGVDGQRFDLKPNTIYFTNPGHYRSFAYEELKKAFLITLTEGFLKESVHADIFEEFPFLLIETLPALTLPPERFAVFERLCQQIAHEYGQKSPFRQALIGHLFVVLLLKFKEEFGLRYNARHEGSRRSAIVRHFRRDLEQHYRELAHGRGGAVRRVADYAAAQHLHPTYLSTVIKSKTGKTIGTWIAEKTIAEAKSLLRHSAVSVKEIAYRLGFAEPAHFSNYFRKHARQTPSAYRRHELVAGG